eukprot:TRINITY_DN5281_c0_g1_i1.p1 TRINITY_DN5281_c0_g1~~TRINITY_DN5281_c0_g1_i1.p1  ORF type:complete len:1054 (-),score=254.54 TRINITY_DN5281_c0_g1_i1:614-3775(-)
MEDKHSEIVRQLCDELEKKEFEDNDSLEKESAEKDLLEQESPEHNLEQDESQEKESAEELQEKESTEQNLEENESAEQETAEQETAGKETSGKEFDEQDSQEKNTAMIVDGYAEHDRPVESRERDGNNQGFLEEEKVHHHDSLGESITTSQQSHPPRPPALPSEALRRSPRSWITHTVPDYQVIHTMSRTSAKSVTLDKGTIPDGIASRDIFLNYDKGMKVDQPHYTSLALFAEVKLLEAKTKGEQMGFPNAFMTAAGCDILNRISSLGGPLGNSVARLRRGFFKAIYVDYADSWLRYDGLNRIRDLIPSSTGPIQDRSDESSSTDADPINAFSLATQLSYFDFLKKVNYERQMLEIDRDKWIGMNERLHKAAARGPLSINSIISRWQNTLLIFSFKHWYRIHATYKQEVKNHSKFLMCWMNFTLHKAFNHWRRRTLFVKKLKHRWTVEKKESDLYEFQVSQAQLEAQCEQLQIKMLALEDELREAHELKKYNDFLMKERLKAQKGENSVYIRFGAQLTEPVTREFIRTMTRASNSEIRNIASLLQGKETIQELLDLSPDKLIMRWVNFHLDRMKQSRKIENFSSDLRDSTVYTYLLHSICPESCNLSGLNEIDFSERARRVVQSATNIGFMDLITIDTIVNASPENADIHLLFLIQLFAKYPRLIVPYSDNPLSEAFEDATDKGLPILGQTEYRDCGYEGSNPELLMRCREFRALIDLWEKITKVAESDEVSSKEKILELSIRFSAVKAGIKKTTDYSSEILQTFESAVTQTEMLSRRLIANRLRGQPVTIEDPREQKDFEQYTKVNKRKIMDILDQVEDADNQITEIENALVQNFMTLKSVFRNYARGYAISSAEFWDFVKDCRLPSASLPATAIDAIFQKSNMSLDDTDVDEEENPAEELIPSEFIECLLRICAARWSKSTLSLPAKLHKLIKENIIPKAGKTDATRFRKEIYDQSVQEVFAKHRTRLEKIFLYYARQDVQSEDSKQHTDTINVNEFFQMCKECALVDSSFGMKQITTIFCNIQIEGEMKNMSNDEKYKELIFPEFLEVV